MPAGRVSMRHVREILRLVSAGISKHEIARRMGLAPSTVRETLKRFEAAGWPGRCRMTSTDGGARSEAVQERRARSRAIAAGRAGLGGDPSRAQAQARHALDPVGGVHRASIPTGIAIPASAISTGPGKASCRSRCARPMPAARSCSSITPATGCRW